MKHRLALILLTAMGLTLLGYTALRTLDLIQLTLAASQQTIGYLALVAFDGGLIGWTLFLLHGAQGAWQRAISALMIVVSLAGVVLGFTADTLYQAAARGTLLSVDARLIETAVYGMAAIIGLNIAAVTATHLTDPAARRAQAEEEAQDKITDAAITAISKNADALAAELAPKLGEDWLADMRARFLHANGDTPGPSRNGQSYAATLSKVEGPAPKGTSPKKE